MYLNQAHQTLALQIRIPTPQRQREMAKDKEMLRSSSDAETSLLTPNAASRAPPGTR